ncbi:MAG: DUF1819 family protein [Methanobrevibacter sp.]|uniref:DUF1819 family protein n=1 Tax=Methanobrevibacter sp. TaxID=66852 RepID=UPI0026E02864|nr:DUF1819 family protein [Methanobrevibacter sp.]MDO5849540.1 DUF1819 family protein [Methanobrevibacter sp.]
MNYTMQLSYLPFWFFETKKMAELLLDGLDKKEIMELSLDDNIFQLNSERRRKEIVNTLFKRLDGFSDELLEKFLQVDTDSARFFVLVSILKNDMLFFEFIREVFRDHMILGNFKLENSDFEIFFENKAMQSEKVANWQEVTLKKLKSGYKTILRESNLLIEDDMFSIPFIDLDLKAMLLNENYGAFIEAIFVN